MGRRSKATKGLRKLQQEDFVTVEQFCALVCMGLVV